MQRKSSYWGYKSMVVIPERFTSSIKHLIEWHLETYVPDRLFNIRLERILEHFYERNLVDGMVEVRESDLYEIHECVSNATTSIPECGIERDIVWDIWSWVNTERKRTNT